jgi:hypothetical protein
MTPIPGEGLIDDKESSQFRVLFQLELEKDLGSFQSFRFGKNNPFAGTCYHRRLDLFYYWDPGLKAGKSFPFWTEK